MMRWLGMLSAVIVLAAVFIGFNTLAAWGFDFGQIAGLVLPVIAGVAVLVVALFWLGRWSARMLSSLDEEKRSGPEN